MTEQLSYQPESEINLEQLPEATGENILGLPSVGMLGIELEEDTIGSSYMAEELEPDIGPIVKGKYVVGKSLDGAGEDHGFIMGNGKKGDSKKIVRPKMPNEVGPDVHQGEISANGMRPVKPPEKIKDAAEKMRKAIIGDPTPEPPKS
jgi:hypothetical protein